MTSAPRLVLDLGSGVAPWRQVRDQLALLLAGGQLPMETQLPTILQLTGDLGLWPVLVLNWPTRAQHARRDPACNRR